MTLPVFVGIDVAKATLDVAVRPSGERWQLANEDAALTLLVARLQPLAPTLVVLEATGGFEHAAVADGLWDVYYRSVKLGRFSDRTGRIEDDRGRLTRRRRLSTMSPV